MIFLELQTPQSNTSPTHPSKDPAPHHTPKRDQVLSSLPCTPSRWKKAVERQKQWCDSHSNPRDHYSLPCSPHDPHQCRKHHLFLAVLCPGSAVPLIQSKPPFPEPGTRPAGAFSPDSYRHTCISPTTILPFSISIFIDFWGTHFWDVWYHWIILFSNLFVSLFMHWIDSFFHRLSKKDAATVVIWLS